MINTAIVILTLNAGAQFEKLLKSIEKQNFAITRRLVADSGSTDQTIYLAQKYDYEILNVDKSTFNHGDTRKCCVEYLDDIDVVIFVTQDVIMADEGSVGELVKAFADLDVAVSYGRQLPHENASPLAVQNRLFNYRDESLVKTYEDRFRLGVKTPFTSDSFAAYRVSLLKSVGNFPHVIVSEDMYVAAKLLMAGYKIVYAAEACVYHSHNYTLKQELNRYFDIGVFMGKENWIEDNFGGAEGEGFKLVKNQIVFLYCQYGIGSIPKAIVLNVIKLIGYRLGIGERFLPKRLKKLLSGQSYFFD